MRIDFVAGPMDGFSADFAPKRIPQQVQFDHRSKSTGEFFSTYRYDSERKRFLFAGTFKTDQGIAHRDSVVARSWLEFVGEGKVWSRWITVTELKEGNQ